MKYLIYLVIVISLNGALNNIGDYEQKGLLVGSPVSDTVPSSTLDIPGEYILIFNDSSQDRGLSVLKNSFGAKHLAESQLKQNAYIIIQRIFPVLRMKFTDLVSVDSFMMVAKLDSTVLDSARKDQRFKFIERNYKIVLPIPTIDSVQLQQEQANWGVKCVSNSIKVNIESRKKVWLLDSGVDPNHVELNIDISKSRSKVPNSSFSDVGGLDSHGTHLAGIIGGKNNGIGIIGVAPNASIIAIKIMKGGEILYNAYLSALEDVKKEGNSGDVLNLSFEGTKGSAAEVAQIVEIGKKGIYVVMSAGNRHFNIQTYNVYPAKIEGTNLYSISSFNKHKTFSYFSNYGIPVKYCGPGDSILSTLPNNRYGYADGTSQATAYASGILYLNGIINSAGTIRRVDDNLIYAEAHE